MQHEQRNDAATSDTSVPSLHNTQGSSVDRDPHIQETAAGSTANAQPQTGEQEQLETEEQHQHQPETGGFAGRLGPAASNTTMLPAVLKLLDLCRDEQCGSATNQVPTASVFS